MQKTPQKAARKFKYKVTGVWLQSGSTIIWPNHINVSSSVKPNKDLDIYLTTLEGWIVFDHKGQLGATNGVATIELEEISVE